MRRRGAFLLALAALPAGGAADAAGLLDPTPRVAVVSAFAPELAALRARTRVEREVSDAGVAYTLGRLAGREVVLLLSGVSMANAVMTTQMLLDRFEVEGVVFGGIAGGVDPALRIGDVVVPERWGQYLEAVFARETAEGGHELPPFVRPAPFAGFGMIHPQPVTVRSAARPEGEERFWFEVDPGMLAAARAIGGSLRLERCAGPDRCLEREPRLQVGGNGVSGQAFVDNAAFREYAFATFRAEVLDMESAGVAAVARANARPFIAFRSLSDLAGGGEGGNQMETFLELAAGNAAEAVTAFLAAWRP